MSSNSNKRWGASVKAVVVAAIMLLCAVSPMVSVFEDKNTLSAESADDVTIVSLGDSMVNGFGLSGYYPEGDANYYGFLEQDTSAFPSLIRDWFVDNGYDVELHQLAISGVRSTDLRALLDPGFEGDEYTKEIMSDKSGIKDVYNFATAIGYTGDDPESALREYFTEKIAIADYITYNFHYDFGKYITEAIMGFVEEGDAYDAELDFGIYIEPEYQEMMCELVDKITAAISKALAENDIDLNEILQEEGINLADYKGVMDFVEPVATAVAYTAIGYCMNFDANMELISTLNPDAKVLVIDSYNTFHDIDMKYGETLVPLGDIYGVIMNVVNMYTQYLSPWSKWTYHVDLDIDKIPLSIDGFKNALVGGEVSDDEKNLLMSGLDYLTDGMLSGEDRNVDRYYDWVAQYNNYFNADGNFEKFFGYLFSNNVLDWETFVDGGMDATTETMSAKMPFTFDLNGKTVVSNADGSITISGIWAYGEKVPFILDNKDGTVTIMHSADVKDWYTIDDGTVALDGDTATITFTQGEVSVLWMGLYLTAIEAVMSHPNTDGHAYIASETIAVIEEIGGLDNEQDEIIGDIEEIVDQIDIEELKAYLAAEIAKIKEKVEAYMAESDVDMDEIKAYVASEVAKLRTEIEAYVDEAVAEIEAFIATELPALREKYQALAEKAIAEIEAYVKMVVAEIETFVDHAIEEILAFFAPFCPTPVPPEAGDADSIGDIIVIGDELTGIGIGETYTGIIAKALGSELNEDWVIPGLRMDDVAYLIGATERCDGYTEMIVAGIMDETGKTVKEIQGAFASAITQSDLVVVQAMANSFKFPIMQAGLLLEGEAALDFDINALEIVSDDMYAEMITVANKVDTFVYDLFGDDAEAMSTYGTVRSIMASTMYSALGYVESYAMVASALDVINPCAEAVFIGMWNPLSSFTYTDSNYGFVIDVGQIAGDIIWAVNGISALTVAPFGAHFIDISDAEIFADVYAATYGPNALEGIDFANEEELMLALVKCMMTENGHQMVADRILAVAGDGHDVDLEYNITHHWMVCKDCGLVVGSPVPHTFDQEVVDKKYLASEATADSPARYYKSCICGVTSDVDTFEYGEAAGGIKTEESVVNGGDLVEKTYPDGKVTYEWTHADGIVITGTVTASGAASFEVDVTVPAGVDDVDAIIGQALAALDEIAPAGNMTLVIDVAFPAADLDFEIGSEILAKIAAKKATVNFNAGDFQMSFGHQVASTMAAKNGKVAITMDDADKTGLNDAQKAKAGDRRVIMLDADVGGQKIHDLGGTATLWFKHQNTGASPVVYHMDDAGELDSRSTTYSSGKVKFTSPTFSYYMVGTAADAGSGSDDKDGGDDNTMLIIGAVVAVIAVIAVAAFLYLRKN